MPLVRIDTSESHDPAVTQKISDAIQSAMVDSIGIPADDRFHLFSSNSTRVYDREYLGIARSDRTIFIEITLRNGRSAEQKKHLYALAADRVSAAAGIERGDVFVVMRENSAGDWSFGDGVMQYAHMLEPVAH